MNPLYSENWFEPEGRGIPFCLVEELLQKCRYGSHNSIGIRLLKETGCRIVELENMKRSNLHGDIIWWPCSKNQTGQWRKERLSEGLLKEMQTYWDRHKVQPDAVFGLRGETIARYFNRDIRPRLGQEWQH